MVFMSGKRFEYIQEQRFAYVFKCHEYKLYTLALQLTKSDLYAKDIVQEVFLKLWQDRRNIFDSDQTEQWLFRMTEAKIIKFLSRTAYDRRLRDALWVNMQCLLNEKEEVTAPIAEYHSVMEKAINHLPPQRQRIYQLHNESYLNYDWVFTENRPNTYINYFKGMLNRIKSFFN